MNLDIQNEMKINAHADEFEVENSVIIIEY